MKLSLLHKILEFKVITQALTLKKGAMTILSMPLAVSITKAIQILLKDVEMYNIVLPLITISVGMFLYIIIWGVDFITGLVASGYEMNWQKGWVKSHKLYSSFGKLGGVLLIDFIMLCIILFLSIVSFKKISLWVLVFASCINVLAMSYELHSINENIERRTGKTIPLLSFFDKITSLIESKIIDKLNEKLQ